MLIRLVHGTANIVSKTTASATREGGFRIGRIAAVGGWLLTLLFAISGTIFAQWVAHGPSPNTEGQVEGITDRPVVGAIHAVAPHPTNATIVYVGAVNGGLWKTTNATAAEPTWERLTDTEASQSIGALEFDLTDVTNQTLVAGIGRFSAYARRGGDRTGILRTTDGGINWTAIDGGGDISGLNISGVAARGATIVVSANQADAFANRGIWRSTNTDGAWTQISGGATSGLPTGPSYDLAGDPSDQNRLFTNAGTSGVYRSTDAGDTWTKVSDAAMDALITFFTTNIEISVGTSNNVFAAIINNDQLAGLFRSGDSGDNWTSLDIPSTVEDGAVSFGIHPGAQGDIHMSIVADPTNANIVYVGGDRQPGFTEGTGWGWPVWPNSVGAGDFSGRLYRVDASQPSGSQASHITHSNTATSSSPHADSRDMAFSAGGDLIEVDDGGIYRRTTPQLNTGDWFSMNGDIQVTEFHDAAWDAVSNIVIGGAQDVGTPEQVLPTNVRWQAVSNGDGGDVAVDDITTPSFSTRYSSYWGLGDFRRQIYDASNVFQSEINPSLTLDAGAPFSAQFYTPVELNTVDPTRFILGGSNSVYESMNQGDNITEIGAGIVVNSSGAHPIAYGATGNPDVLYVGSQARVFVRTAAPPAGLTQSAAYTGGWVADLAIDPDDPQTAFVVDDAAVFQTTNAGTGWTDITGDLQTLDPGTLRSVTYSTANTDGRVVVGGDHGVYSAIGPTFTTWTRLGANFPTVPVYELEYDAADEILLAGTLGRGAWTHSFAERDPVDIMLVLDISGSMQSSACSGCDPKLDVLKDAVEIFIQLWTALAVTDDRLGVTYFRTNVDDFQVSGTTLLPVIDNAPAMISDVQSQTTNWSNLTAMGGGLQFAINTMNDATRIRNIILFTDGMQNMNPMVQTSDLDIENEPGRTNSNISPTSPTPTRLNMALDIDVNTIGIGATPPFTNLLDDIAVSTDGLPKLTTAPDDELRRFYVEDLVNALRNYSPQLLAYRNGSLISSTSTETFTANTGVRKITLKLSWDRSDSLSFSVEKDGVDVTRYGRLIGGQFYLIFTMDLPAEVQGTSISPGGDWQMHIYGTQGTAYEAAAIVEEPLLDYEFHLGPKDCIVGNPLDVRVNLAYQGLPITDADRMTVTVHKPGRGLGTLLSVNAMPPEPTGFAAESTATDGQRKLQLLMQDDRFQADLKPVAHPITLSNNGDGSYSTTFSNADVTGIYKVTFQVEGDRSDIGEYERTEIRTTTVRFGAADCDASKLSFSELKKTADGSNMLMTIRPKDVLGNYLGPDYGDRIRLTLSDGTVGSDKRDLVDGSYTVPFFVPAGTDPVVTVSVMDKDVYSGPISGVERESRFTISVHAGTTLPLGDFNKLFDPGYLVEVDLEYRLRSRLSLEAVLGRYAFDPSFDITGGTLYSKLYLPGPNWRLFCAAGPGVYKPERMDAAFGFSVGVGVSRTLTPRIQGDFGMYYFHIMPEGDDIDFVGVKTGVRYSL